MMNLITWKNVQKIALSIEHKEKTLNVAVAMLDGGTLKQFLDALPTKHQWWVPHKPVTLAATVIAFESSHVSGVWGAAASLATGIATGYGAKVGRYVGMRVGALYNTAASFCAENFAKKKDLKGTYHIKYQKGQTESGLFAQNLEIRLYLAALLGIIGGMFVGSTAGAIFTYQKTKPVLETLALKYQNMHPSIPVRRVSQAAGSGQKTSLRP